MNARVHFDENMMGRLGLLVGRMRSQVARREGSGAARLAGAGEEFVGHRPWRPGEDTRDLDWDLLARFDQPFVRVKRREAAENWCVLLDTSASMDVEGKLQLAAEVVMGLGALALEVGARLTVQATCGAAYQLARSAGLKGLWAMLEGLGEGAAGLDEGLVVRGRAGRVFVIGDLFDVEPRDVLELGARGRELVVMRILAGVELLPSRFLFENGAVAAQLREPEQGERLMVGVASARDYERAMELELEAWETALARHRGLWRLGEAGTAFEDLLAPFVGGMG